MGRINVYAHAFNVGVQDKKHLLRVDLERMRLAAEQQTNILALTTGPGFMRPGFEFLDTTENNNVSWLKPFVFGATDAALMEFTDSVFRVRVNDVLVTRPAVTAVVTNGDFSSPTGWTLAPTAGAQASIASGLLVLIATARGSRAVASQQVTVNEPGIEHALRVEVAVGPVTLRVGSVSGIDDYIAETTLRTGTHSLAFTPGAGSFHITLLSEAKSIKYVNSIQVESAGIMQVPTIWTLSDLPKIRLAQSADVIFVACAGKRQQRIERRATRSWSVVDYTSDDGPFTVGRTRDLKLTPSINEGTGTLSASKPFFNPGHIGALFRLRHDKHNETVSLAAEDTFTEPFRVTGISDAAPDAQVNERQWTYTITGTWSGTLRWQRSFDGKDSGYKAFQITYNSTVTAITANVSASNSERDDNAIIWYKIGFQPGEYTSGSATINTAYDGGGGSGICRVTAYNSSASVNIEVLSPFSQTVSTEDWQESEWGANQYFPTAVGFSDGRLWWAGSDRVWASVSDGFESFDDTVEGDSGPISRSIAAGGVNDTQWIMGLQRLLFGTDGSIVTAKSSSFDEPITPTNLTMKESSSTGAASIEPVKIDGRGIFVERSGTALYELSFDGQSSDYVATQLSKLVTELFSGKVRQMAVQRRPDTRIWVVMQDGTCVCVIYEPLEQVLAFIPIETLGSIESIAVLPALTQDRVYAAIRRTVNGSTVRYVEKMAMDSEVKPATLCKVMDAFKTNINSPASTLLDIGTHLAGETVVVWADGAPIETAPGIPAEFVVSDLGTVTLATAVTNWVAGLPYRCRYKSARLAYGAEGGTAMLVQKKVNGVGLVMTDFVRSGIRYGQGFDDAARPLDPLPALKDYVTAPAIVNSDVAEEEPFVFPGEWNTDSRVCMEWQSPYTATMLAMTISVTTNG